MPFTLGSTRLVNAARHPLTLFALGFGLVTGVAVAIPDANSPSPAPQFELIETLEVDTSSILGFSNESFLNEAVIERGDTIQELLLRLQVRDSSASRYLSNSPEALPLRKEFIAGRRISATVNSAGQLLRLHFPLSNPETALSITRTNDGFLASVVAERPETHLTTKKATISSSLFASTDLANIPDSVAVQLAEIFSSEIDFHRDLRPGDSFIVSYEVHYLQGQPTRTGRVLAAEFTNDGKTLDAVWFAKNEQQGEYLNRAGKPLKKSFLKSPLEFSRISSGFSNRFHPILKTWRAHRGVDYAAPIGTPIRATANAVVEFAGTQRGYGNTIILKHDAKYSTLYAHLSRFQPGIRKGTKVSQGQTIGYVGKTGWATGPHLHYEFKVNGSAVNPLSVQLPTLASSLSRDELGKFQRHAETKFAQLDQIRHVTTVFME